MGSFRIFLVSASFLVLTSNGALAKAPTDPEQYVDQVFKLLGCKVTQDDFLKHLEKDGYFDTKTNLAIGSFGESISEAMQAMNGEGKWKFVSENRVSKYVSNFGACASADGGQRIDEHGFIQAARKGDLLTVKTFVANEGDINAQGALRQTALHVASETGQLEVVKYLLQNGADQTVLDLNGRSPVFLAAYESHTEVVKHHIDSGFDVNGEVLDGADTGKTLLMIAVMKSNENLIAYLLDQGANGKGKSYYDNETVLDLLEFKRSLDKPISPELEKRILTLQK